MMKIRFHTDLGHGGRKALAVYYVQQAAHTMRRMSIQMQTKIYDIGNSVLMGLDVLGTVLELKKEDPVTIGGCAHKSYREYIRSLVPCEYEPKLHPDLRVKKYFREHGLEVAPLNIYAGWIATFFSWVLLPILQPINLYRRLRARRSQNGELTIRPIGRGMMGEAGD